MKKNRNYYVDFIRGLAIISVILIYTAWHSGTKYVPELVRNLTLLFEVPIFFFIAGWTYSYSKNNEKYIKGLLKLQLRYMIYMTIVFLVILISNKNEVQLKELIYWIFHKYSNTYPLQSVQYSLWFMKTYFMTALCGIAIISFTKENKLKYICFVLLLLIILQTFKVKLFSPIIIGLNVSINFIIFYSFIFLIGYILRNYRVTIIKFILSILINIIFLIIGKYVFDYDIFDIQTSKQNTSIIYLVWSMFGIYIVMFLKNYITNMKENIIVKLGQNSIYLYFAQGISSSLLYCISPQINLNWYIKLPIMFAINLIMALLIMFILKYSIEYIINIPQYILKLKQMKGNYNEENS